MRPQLLHQRQQRLAASEASAPPLRRLPLLLVVSGRPRRPLLHLAASVPLHRPLLSVASEPPQLHQLPPPPLAASVPLHPPLLLPEPSVATEPPHV